MPHVMTGVAWGNYQDYLDGKVDGREHWDETQAAADGSSISTGRRVPYMVPSVSFSDYLEEGVRRAIDAGAVAVHLEEPEFWARADSVEAFQREWQILLWRALATSGQQRRCPVPGQQTQVLLVSTNARSSLLNHEGVLPW